ncbi:hypothetical protein THRCLA_22794 [Thraustotheca clavata]|uniref:Uncharacterized protein n=1 Tax=Thraustotheca clavata TaxID=74557 RepID=A0A1V9YSI9_9STRA|nr:hypothetical protein THRCLA_22794 [Thraustotheca clavata]
MDNPHCFWILLYGYGNVNDICIAFMPLYMFFAAIYYLGSFHVIYPACGRRLIVASCKLWPSLAPSSYTQWSLVGETAQTIAQLLQAYKHSQCDVNLEVTTGYTILVGISIVLSPWFFLFPDPFVHQDLWHLIFSSLLSFILATGYYSVLVMLDKFIQCNGLQNTPYYRYIAPTSALDLSEKAILFFMSWVNVQRLVYTTNNRKGPRVTSVVPTPRIRTISRVTIQIQSKSFQILLSYKVIIGLLVIVNGLYNAIKSPECPKGCLLATHPWFSRRCECAYFKLVCQDAIDFTTILTHDYLGSSLFFLHITGLFGLTIEFSNMTSWAKGDQPESVMLALLHLPPNCKELTIAQSLNISTLPDVMEKARTTLSQLVLNNNQFSNIPEWIGKLTTLERLVHSSNALESIPEARIARLPGTNCNNIFVFKASFELKS